MRNKPNKSEAVPGVAVQRSVSRPVAASDVVKYIALLFGIEQISVQKFKAAHRAVRAIWHDGFNCGVAMQKSKPALFKKVNAILHGKEGG